MKERVSKGGGGTPDFLSRWSPGGARQLCVCDIYGFHYVQKERTAPESVQHLCFAPPDDKRLSTGAWLNPTWPRSQPPGTKEAKEKMWERIAYVDLKT